MPKLQKFIFRTAYYIFACLIAAIAFLLIVSVVPIPGNYKVLIVLSGSMEPEIKVGSIVAIKPSSDYKAGDVITFLASEKSETPITHRIVNVEGAGERILYEVKGDVNEDSDRNKVLKENVIGKVLFSVPFLGYLLNFAKEPAGFILLVWVPALIIILEEIRKIGREVKKTRNQKTEKTLLENKEDKEKTEKKLSVASVENGERKLESSNAPLIIHPQPFYPEEKREEEKKKTVQLKTKKADGSKGDKKKTKTKIKTKTVKNNRPSA